MRLSTVAASETSRALVGSSQSSTSGGTTVARASAARWRCPPESCAGLDSATSGGQPDPLQRGLDTAYPVRLVSTVLGAQALTDEFTDREPWRQRRAGVLEDHLGSGAAAELDRARIDGSAGRQ